MKKHFYISLILLLGIVVQAFPQSMIISGGNDHGVVICAQGYLYAWGKNSNNQLGLIPAYSSQAIVATPREVNMGTLTFSQVTAGSGAHNVALACNKLVYAWGENRQYQCGSTTPNVVTSPQPVPCGEAPGYDINGNPGGPYLGGVKFVAASTAGSFALLETGQVVAWGGNGDGGKWIATPTATPKYIRRTNPTTGPILQNVVHICGGDNNATFLTDPNGTGLGQLYSIGNWNGRGGDGATDAYTAEPVMNGETNPATPLVNIKMAAVMDVGGFAVDGVTGYVYGWGNGGWGCCNGLPNNQTTTNARRIPSGQYRAISGEDYLTDVIEVAGGNGYGAAITKEGYLLYWGNNTPTAGSGGTLPNGNGGTSTCDTGPQFGVYCTGTNYTTSTVNSTNPLANPNLVKDAVKISRGDNFGFIVNKSGDFYVWGSNSESGASANYVGALGLGSANTPTHINCLAKFTVPCVLPDQCPEAYMVGRREKCPESPMTLFSGFTTPTGKEDSYYFRWFHNGTLLNTTTKDSPAAARRADVYNKMEITINDPGTYMVEIEYIDVNVPCNTCQMSSATVEVINKEMPINPLVPLSCVANPLAPTTADNICFEFNSKYSTQARPINGQFEVYKNRSGGAVITTNDGRTVINTTTTNPLGQFCVKGNQIDRVEVIGNDTLYSIWIEDKTKEQGTVIRSTTPPTQDGGNQRYYALLECWNNVILETVDLYIQSYYGPKTGTITPVIYSVTKNNNRDMPGTAIWTGTPQTFNYDSDRTYLAQVSFNNYLLTANPSRGTTYYLGFTFTGIDKVMRNTAPVGTGNNDNIFTTSFKDNIDQSTLLVIGVAKDGNPSNEYIITNLKFSKTSSYDCGRLKLTSKYYCPPCLTPDRSSPNGKSVEITPSKAADATRTVNLCKESATLTLSTNTLMLNGTPNSTQFNIEWYKNGTSIQGPTQASSSSVSNITWSSIGSGNTATYVIRVNDREKLPNIACPVYDTIYVKAIPKPAVPNNTMVGNFCQGSTPPSLPAFSGFTSYQWYDESMNPVSSISGAVASNPGIHNYHVTVSDSYGCVSDTVTIPVEVIANPSPVTINRNVVYYRADIQANNTFLNLLAQDAGFLTQTPGMELLWLQPDGTWNTTVPVPSTPDPDDFTDKTYTYQVKQKRILTPSCESQPATVTVKIYLIPVPTVSSLSYCLNESANPLTAVKNPSPGYTDSDYELRWYANASTPTYSTTAPTPNTSVASQTTYYVSQLNTTSGAESSRVELIVTVYAKPDLQITSPSPVCTPNTINITPKNMVWSISNEAAIAPTITAEYFENSGASTVLSNPAALGTVGINTYYIRAGFTKPGNAANAGNCYSDVKPVTVNVQDLSISISGSPTACPNTDVTLTAVPSANNNSGAITYNWNNNAGSNPTFNTGALAGPQGRIHTINLEITQGTCTAQTTHDIEIGDGPIVGNMTVSEASNANSPAVFAPNDAKNFYSCGGNVTISVNYTSNLNDFVWTNIGTGLQVGTGSTITIPQPSGTETYRVTFTNGCPTSTTVTIHAIPLTVVPNNPGMSLCEGNQFRAELTIICTETPTVNWYWNGNLIPSATSSNYVINSVTPANSGVYAYTVTNRGCSSSGTISSPAPESKTTLDVSAMVTWNKIPTQVVCEGGQKVVGLEDVYPPTTALLWDNDNTIIGPRNGLTATVEPTYNTSNNHNHRSIYTYKITATNVYCSRDIEIEIYVDEPLRSTVDMNKTICEGTSAVLNARSYEAGTYEWWKLYPDTTIIAGTTATITESPLVTTHYQLSMTRGECSFDTTVTITVNRRPVIERIDSLDVRERLIVAANGYGTYPLSYGVDNQPPTDDPRKSGLLFANHTFYIIDAIGCISLSKEDYLEAPKLFPPNFFTPNGDGYNDTWEIPGIRKIYPDAVIAIYDRFGKKLIEYKGSDDPGWDGKYLGKDMPTTDYWYEINIKEINKQYVGHFTLLRR